MSLTVVSLLTAFSLGLFGSVHCVAMCGGLSCAASMVAEAPPSKNLWLARLTRLLVYNSGRLSSYFLVGLIAGALSYWFLEFWQGMTIVLRSLAGFVLIAMGLYLAGLTRTVASLENRLFRVSRFVAQRSGLGSWVSVSPFADRRSAKNVFMLGVMWGWLPCGLVYSALAWSSSLAVGGFETGLLMLFFGLGTMPAMMATGWLGDALSAFAQSREIRLLAGLCIVLYGCWTLVGGFSSHHHDDTSTVPHHHVHKLPDKPLAAGWAFPESEADSGANAEISAGSHITPIAQPKIAVEQRLPVIAVNGQIRARHSLQMSILYPLTQIKQWPLGASRLQATSFYQDCSLCLL